MRFGGKRILQDLLSGWVWMKLTSEKRDAVRRESSDVSEDLPALRSELTWTHYRLLLRVEMERLRKDHSCDFP